MNNNSKLLELLAVGYPDGQCILDSYDHDSGQAVLFDGDSLAHFVVSEALSVTDGKTDRPKDPLVFDVGLAMQKASAELARLAEHCRQAGIQQMVDTFLREMKDSKRQSFSAATLEQWLCVIGDTDMLLMQDDMLLCLWRHFLEQTRGTGPWIITREDLLNLKLPDKV